MHYTDFKNILKHLSFSENTNQSKVGNICVTDQPYMLLVCKMLQNTERWLDWQINLSF